MFADEPGEFQVRILGARWLAAAGNLPIRYVDAKPIPFLDQKSANNLVHRDFGLIHRFNWADFNQPNVLPAILQDIKRIRCERRSDDHLQQFIDARNDLGDRQIQRAVQSDDPAECGERVALIGAGECRRKIIRSRRSARRSVFHNADGRFGELFDAG